MKKLLILLALFVPLFSYAYDYPKSDGYHVDFNKDGSTRLAGGTTTQRNIAARTWESSTEYEKTKSWFNRSMSSGSASLENGAKINSKVPVSLKNTVSKKSVMRGLLSNARKGGRLASRNPWVFLAFTLVGDKLFDEANKLTFKWDSEAGDYVTADSYIIVLHMAGKDYTVAGITQQQYEIGLSTFSGKVRSSCESFAPKVADYYGHDSAKLIAFTTISGEDPSSGPGSTGLRCDFETNEGTLGLVFAGARQNTVRPITQDEFDDIMIPIADNEPSEYVNASRPSQNGTLDGFNPVGHELTKGASYSTDIYSDPSDGKAKSTSVTVNSDGTSVSYSHTLRPDLDGDTEVAPIPTPNTTDNDTETPETPTSASVPLQCDSDKYPDSLGCVDTTEEIKDASMVIPQENVDLDFEVKNYISSSSGSCPQGSQFTINFFGSRSFEFSFEPACKFASMIKYVLWLCSWLVAYFMIMGRSE